MLRTDCIEIKFAIMFIVLSKILEKSRVKH